MSLPREVEMSKAAVIDLTEKKGALKHKQFNQFATPETVSKSKCSSDSTII